jgi:periplasmic protein TonB
MQIVYAIKSLEKWQPGTKNGIAVKMRTKKLIFYVDNNSEISDSEDIEVIIDETPKNAANKNYEITSEDVIVNKVDELPEFSGGNSALLKFIEKNLRIPIPAKENNIKGKVFLYFIVHSDGSIDNVQILKGLGFGCDEESIRLVRSMPIWKPGKLDGKKVTCKYNLTLEFKY